MYDHIKVEYPLQSLPQDLIDLWQGDIVFQTKDTPDQYMSLYKIDGDGRLWYEERETEWVEPVDPDGESIMDSLGHMKTISTSWKGVNFHGTINFYEGYNHKEYKFEFNSGESKEWQRYEMGWIEYQALFKDGQMISIDLVRDDKPVKLTDEELEAKRIEWAKQREEIQNNCRENRKKYPTGEQKLIDSIYKMAEDAVDLMNEKVISNHFAKGIIEQIDEYRQKYDRFYTNE
jgi:hypothetical protein